MPLTLFPVFDAIAGNTAGALATVSTGTFVLAGGNNITLSQDGNTVTISGAAGGGGAADGGNTIAAGTRTAGSNSVVLFSNSNGISFGLDTVNGSVLTASYTVPTVPPVTNSSWTVSDNATSATVGRLAFTQSNGLTLSLSTSNNGNHTVIGSYTVPTVTNSSWTVSDANTSATVGRLAFTQSNGLTLSLITSNNGNHTVVGSYTVPTQSVQTQNMVAIIGSGANGNGTFSSGTLSLKAGNNITLSTGANVISFHGEAAQTVQSQNFIAAIVSGANGNGTYTSGTLSFKAGNNITLSTGANVFSIHGPAQTNQSAIKGLGASNTGNTVGNTGLSTGIDWVLAGSNIITISQSTSVGGPNTLWVNATTVAQTNQSAIKGLGVSNTGNSAGNTGLSTGIDWVIAGSGVATASQSTVGGGPNTIWINVPAGGGAGDGYNILAAGTQTANTTGTILFADSNGVTFGMSNSTKITASVAATSSFTATNGLSISTNGSTITVSAIPVSEFFPAGMDLTNGLTNSTLGQSTLYFVPFDVKWPVSGSRLNVYLSIGTATNTNNSTGSGSIGLGYGLYTRGTGASVDRLSQLTSYSMSLLSYSFSSNTRLGVTYYNGLSNATSHSTATFSNATSNVSTFWANSIGGYRYVAFPLNQTLSPGRYWLGISQQSTTANNTVFSANISVLQLTVSGINYVAFGTSSSASNAAEGVTSPGMGIYSAQSGAWPGSIGLSNSQIRQTLTATIPIFNISGISTATWMP